MEFITEISVLYNDKDIKESLFHYIFRISKLWIFYLPIFAMIIALLAAALMNIQEAFYTLLFVIFIICFFILHFVYYVNPVNKYRERYSNKGLILHKFSKKEVYIEYDQYNVTFQWTYFKKAYNTPYSIILVDQKRAVYIMPKRCFKNCSDISLLQTIISENIKIFDC